MCSASLTSTSTRALIFHIYSYVPEYEALAGMCISLSLPWPVSSAVKPLILRIPVTSEKLFSLIEQFRKHAFLLLVVQLISKIIGS